MKENKKTQQEETSKTMSSDVEKVKGQQTPAPPKQPGNKQTGSRNEEEEAEKGHS
jgi:hypothetical protein